jgi:hypothetical protein
MSLKRSLNASKNTWRLDSERLILTGKPQKTYWLGSCIDPTAAIAAFMLHFGQAKLFDWSSSVDKLANTIELEAEVRKKVV